MNINALIFGCSFLLIFSCNSKKDSSPSPLVVDKTFQKSDYPLEVGNYWIYKRFNLNDSTTDTVKIEIVSKDIISADSAEYEVLIFKNALKQDSGIYLVSDSNITFLSSNTINSSFYSFDLKFPLTPGDLWIRLVDTDSVIVKENLINYTLEGTTYASVSNVTREFNYGSSAGGSDLKIVKNIGIIEANFSYFFWFNSRIHLTLLDFHLNEGG
ncbi:MAG: hypothetical protein RH860_12425 [Cytophagales bacterium]